VQPKTVLITGCSSGIGRATATLFLAEGWRVYATARDTADIGELADHDACRTLELDVTIDDHCRRAVNRVMHESGRIDCLVNNAGYGQLGPIEDVPVRQVGKQFDVNVYGPHRLIRLVLPHMREQGNGTIVNVSSLAGRVAFPGGGVYCGSKAALESMTDALRAEIDEYGLDAVLIEPGLVETAFGDRSADESDNAKVPAGVERSGAYEAFYDIFADTRLVGGGAPGSVSAERVAEAIVEAASSPNPAARYPVGAVARFGSFARYVPDRIRDSVYGLAEKYLR
jgi:NAD(P)-dependent dehydrogenase (short-subunit alcohol dehydrogenase family)